MTPISSLLGTGGMDEVYAARDMRLDRRVAIKVLLDSFARDPHRRARFDREVGCCVLFEMLSSASIAKRRSS